MCFFQPIEGGGFQDLESLVAELVICLDSLSENVALNELENDVTQLLAEFLDRLSSPQVDQVLFQLLNRFES